MSTLRQTNRDIKFLSNGKFFRNPYDRFVGIEVEFSNYNNNDVELAKAEGFFNKHYVSVGSDGSIRGGKPTEIRIPPMNGDYLFQFLDEFHEVMTSIEAESNASCGIHMHIDFNDFLVNEMENFFYLWTFVEPFVFRYMLPLHRQNSNWCKPFTSVTFPSLYSLTKGSIKSTFNLKNDPKFKHRFIATTINASNNRLGRLAKQYKQETADKRKGGMRARVPHQEYKRNWMRNISKDRYCAANIAALAKAGTIEFRMFNSNWNNIYLQNWILFLLDLIEFSRNTNMKTLKSYYNLFKPESFTDRGNSPSYQKRVFEKLLEITPESEGFIRQRMKIINREDFK